MDIHAKGLTDALSMKQLTYKADPEPKIHRHMNLTAYEQEVLQKLGGGEVPKRIANELSVSSSAIESCVKNITKKARRQGYIWARVLVKVKENGR